MVPVPTAPPSLQAAPADAQICELLSWRGGKGPVCPFVVCVRWMASWESRRCDTELQTSPRPHCVSAAGGVEADPAAAWRTRARMIGRLGLC